jgi:hypothetical protein
MTPSSLERWFSRAVAAALVTTAHLARAEPTPPVDVVLREPPPPHRIVAVEWNPLALFIARVSVNAIVVPGDHHALVLSPFYTWASTVPYATGIDAGGNPLLDSNGKQFTLNVLSQSFKGFGGELGYRYYWTKGGPRGLFFGPSVLLADMTATAGNGSKTHFLDFGFAADVGYEALVGDAVSVSVGAGVQYTFTSKSIPDQQLPASIYANDAFHPRLLLAVGYAF